MSDKKQGGFFFFFFFNQLYDIPIIREAFFKVCVNKLISDGYCDMSPYVYAKITQEEMVYRLALCKSKYIELYQHDYPTEETAYQAWYSLFPETNRVKSKETLEEVEASAIVYWTYMVLGGEEERTQFTIELFRKEKELSYIDCNIVFKDGVFYNEKKIELKIITSIAKLDQVIGACQNDHETLFYRGHANANYQLQPSIRRKLEWLHNEREMYNELLINCPADFGNCATHLEKLVKMQHYGLPTRLLDITKNPLVALYFACESKFECYGEIVLIAAEKDQVKYPHSDTASILSSLPAFSYSEQRSFAALAQDVGITQKDFNERIMRLLHEIRLEKPAFLAEIEKEDLLKDIVILAIKNNDRIVKQDGAFILCGLLEDLDILNKFKYRKNHKTLVVLVKNKEKILQQLSTFSINRATLFPEIECVSDYVKEKYSV